MRIRLPAAMLALAALLPAATAFAQCANWIAGSFNNSASSYGTDGTVYASILWDPDGAGPLQPELVIAGSFSHVNGVPVDNVARRDPVTGQWSTFIVSGIGPVYALAVYNDQLIIGGANVYYWTGTSFAYLGGGIYDGSVNSFTVWNGNLIMGGSFRIFPSGGSPILYLGQWNGSSWSNVGGGVNNWVEALTVWTGNLMVGGTFNQVGSPAVSASNIAQWNGASWNTLAGGVQHGIVSTFQPYYGGLYVGGNFTAAGAVSCGGLVRWDGANWSSVGGYFNGTVWTLSYFPLYDDLVIGGSFTGIGSPNIVMFNYLSGTYANPGSGGTTSDVHTICLDGAVLDVGGTFTSAGGVPANNVARYTGEGWAPMGGGAAGGVLAMTDYAGRLVIGGGFNQSADPKGAVVNIAGWDGSQLWPYGAGMNGQVNALKAYSYGLGINQTVELVAGGYFTHAGGVATNYIAVWDQSSIVYTPSAWAPMGSGFDGAVLAIERATVNGATNTYAGGLFTNHIARWNATSKVWENIGAMDGTVYALRAYGGYLYAGGSFTTAGGVSTGGLARWNGTGWSSVGGFFGGTVYALEVYNGSLVMAGSFPGFGGSPNISSFNGSSYVNLGSGGTTGGTVEALHAVGSRLYIGGTFTTAGGVGTSHVAYYDGSWHAMTAGVDNTVYAISDYAGETQVGGAFAVAGSVPLLSPTWARWTPTGVPSFQSQPFDQTVNPGDTFSFTAQPEPGYSGVSEQWYRNGVALQDGPDIPGSLVSGSTTPTLTITNASNFTVAGYTAVLTDACGNDTSLSGAMSLPASTGVGADGPAADRFEAIGPNPSRGPSTISFALSRESRVGLVVLDIAGRRVGHADFGMLSAGRHQTSWEARDDQGQTMRSGLYFVSLEVNGRPLGTRRVTIVR